MRPRALVAIGVVWVASWLGGAVPASGGDELDWSFKEKLLAPARQWGEELKKEKNAAGKSIKKYSYSRTPHKVDDSTYELTAHVHTVEENRQVTERYLLTLKRESDPGEWEIAEKEVVVLGSGLLDRQKRLRVWYHADEHRYAGKYRGAH